MRRIYKNCSIVKNRRLFSLLSDRAQDSSCHSEIDEKIIELYGEEWAIMFTDLSGFTKISSKRGILGFLHIIYKSLTIFKDPIEKYNGICIKMDGDSLIILFKHLSKSIECAKKMIIMTERYNKDKKDDDLIRLSIGIGYGKILKIGDYDIFGEEANNASKLRENFAKENEIVLTDAVKKILLDLNGNMEDPKNGSV
jgi:adenylate cyclase